MSANRECRKINELFDKLIKQEERLFPEWRQPLNAPSTHGVYIIRKKKTIVHVGRTIRGVNGLHQRLRNHLYGSSSFTRNHLKGDGSILRQGEYSYQYLELEDETQRAFVEAYAVGNLCPEYIGLG